MIFAVISGLISTCIMLLLGCCEIYVACCKIYLYFFLKKVSTFDGQHDIIQHIINSIDIFLTSTVLLIFSVGLYELFIKKFDITDDNRQQLGVLLIYSLDQLKKKIVQTIIMILVVDFFQRATQLSCGNAIDLVYFGCSVFLMSLSVYFTHSRY